MKSGSENLFHNERASEVGLCFQGPSPGARGAWEPSAALGVGQPLSPPAFGRHPLMIAISTARLLNDH